MSIEIIICPARPNNAILVKNNDKTIHLPMIKENWMLQDLIKLIRPKVIEVLNLQLK